jgi:OmpR family response regulator RpaB
MANIIIIEDDKELGNLVKTYLTKYNHDVSLYENPISGLDSINKTPYDILILDIMLPEMDGFTTLKELRKTSELPVIMLTARGDVSDKIVGLELGADDYMPKPFEPRELLARIDAILRRSKNDEGSKKSIVKFKNLEINYNRREAFLSADNLELTTAEFELLAILVDKKGIVLSRDDIMNNLKGVDANVFSRSIDINIIRLRN